MLAMMNKNYYAIEIILLQRNLRKPNLSPLCIGHAAIDVCANCPSSKLELVCHEKRHHPIDYSGVHASMR